MKRTVHEIFTAASGGETYTFPVGVAKTNIEATFSGSRIVTLSSAASGSGSGSASASASASASGSASASASASASDSASSSSEEALTSGWKTGDWICDPVLNFAGFVVRVIDDETLELLHPHELSGQTASNIIQVSKTPQFRHVSWAVTDRSVRINGETYASGESFGGEGFPHPNQPYLVYFPGSGAVKFVGST